ncbi:hypothetical protein PR048_032915 [Dryococelus australis]|uniref:Uncharacterized protein n=1 Tax=Dryococelus australis TaxID=614101 RepID=A0ABQ9G3K3_9NEOP|nr:hypothetical protein PR048_032915 [Dryococelus australis]
MERRRTASAREAGDPRESPPTSGIVHHDSHMRNYGGSPYGNRTRPDQHATASTTRHLTTNEIQDRFDVIPTVLSYDQ